MAFLAAMTKWFGLCRPQMNMCAPPSPALDRTGGDSDKKVCAAGDGPITPRIVQYLRIYLVAVVCAGCSVDVHDMHALWVAFEADNARVVGRYLDAGLDPNLEIRNNPLLWYAIEHKLANVGPMLVRRGADCNVRLKPDRSPYPHPLLFHAVWSGALDVARACLKHGADIRWKNAEGMNLLAYAAAGGDAAFLRDVHALGFDPRETLVDRSNALHMAFRLVLHNRHVAENTRVLLEWGVNPNQSNIAGDRPLDLAARSNIHWTQVEDSAILLIAAGADTGLRDFMSGGTIVHPNLAKLAGHWGMPRLTAALLTHAPTQTAKSEVCATVRAHVGDRDDLRLAGGSREKVQKMLQQYGCL